VPFTTHVDERFVHVAGPVKVVPLKIAVHSQAGTDDPLNTIFSKSSAQMFTTDTLKIAQEPISTVCESSH